MDERLQLDLAELLCARLCHDLAGPVGAVATGAELLAEEGGDSGEALDLLASSAAAASQRLRFFRLAFGPAAKPVAAGELRELASNFLAGSATSGGTLAVEWRDNANGPWDGGAAKLLLNLLLVARDCLPRGGTLRVTLRPGPDLLADLVAEGQAVATAEAVAGLAGAIPGSPASSPVTSPFGIGPRGAQGFYTGHLANGLGIAVSVVSDPRFVALAARYVKNM